MKLSKKLTLLMISRGAPSSAHVIACVIRRPGTEPARSLGLRTEDEDGWTMAGRVRVPSHNAIINVRS